jgi:hypothetical protein
MTVNLNGIILKKAEIEKNFNVYSRVFEKMYETESTEEDFLSVLGEIGG